MKERRGNTIITDIAVHIIIVCICAAGSGYIAVQVAINTTKIELSHIQEDVVDLKKIIVSVMDIKSTLSRRGEWIRLTEKRIDSLELAVKLLTDQTKDRYPRKTAEADHQLMFREFEVRLREAVKGER